MTQTETTPNQNETRFPLVTPCEREDDMKKSIAVPEGHEIRGFKFKIYPTIEQVAVLQSLQSQCRYIWNTIVRDWDTTYRAREAWAVHNGLVEVYSKNLSETDAQARARTIYQASKPVDGLKPRSLKEWQDQFMVRWDYHLFAKILEWREWPEDRAIPGAPILQGLGKSFFSKGVKRVRKRDADMPLRAKSGKCFVMGDFGMRRSKKFYDCQVQFNGLKILGRLPGRVPTGRVLEGVAITHLADGWYAAIREVIPERKIREPVPGKRVGIDTGLIELAALSDGRIFSNARDRAFSERIAGRQASGQPTGRLQLQAKRHMRQLCQEIARDLADHELVVMERLPSDIGQRGSRRVSSMKQLRNSISDRVRDRLREVDPSYTSQTCSQCGHLSKESWSWEAGRFGRCPACGHEMHRDVNAARNILRRGEELLVNSKT